MPTKNPRINITLEEPVSNFLATLAEHEHKFVSNLAKELLIEALERREDIVLSSIAKKRDLPKSKKIKHDDAWK